MIVMRRPGISDEWGNEDRIFSSPDCWMITLWTLPLNQIINGTQRPKRTFWFSFVEAQ